MRPDATGRVTIPAEVQTPNGPVPSRKTTCGWRRRRRTAGPGAADGDVEVMVDVRITEELALAGMAREVVRHVNELRKTADLNIEDRIILYLGTDGRN